MFPYLALLKQCRQEGVRQKNRTGTDTFMIPGGMMQFNCEAGFPIVTTKKVNFPSIVGELLGFLRGYTNAADFRRLGSNVWNTNADKNKSWLANPHRKGPGDLGMIYGWQWRHWQGLSDEVMECGHAQGTEVDQLTRAVHMIVNDPTSRRIIINAWNPAELDKMALPPCHILHQYIIEQESRKMHMTMYQRSCDMFLGVPFNISSYALLLHLMAHVTGYTPGMLTMFLADVHIYETHLEQVDIQLQRWPRGHPLLVIDNVVSYPTSVELKVAWLNSIGPSNIRLEEYDHCEALKGQMADE